MKIFTHSYRILFLLCFFFAAETLSAQFSIPPKPPKKEQSSMYDYINLLSPAEQTSLEGKLIRYADSTSTQIVIGIISSTQGEEIKFLGTKWAHAWDIGQEDEDNGIFILLAKDDRKISINTGYGVEHLLTDQRSRRIIEREIIPAFKTGGYYEGLDKGADAIFKVMNGEYEEDRDFSDNGIPSELIIVLIFIILFIALSSKRNNGPGGRNSGGTSLLDVIILSNMGRTGGWGGGSSSGGGSWGSGGGGFGGSGGFGGGFGGGGFGGGGASGGW